jgi:histidinol-phosphate aminotransferase
MSRFWNDKVKELIPYTPGEQPKDKKYIKLNTNEFPYAPSPMVEDIIKNYDFKDLRLYPDPDVSELKNEIASFYNLKTENIFIGNGSDEILAFAFMTYFNSGDKIYYPDITYSFYPVYSDLFNLNPETIPVNKNFEIETKDYENLDAGIIIANPNAPTSIALGKTQIEEIVKANKNNIVIIDEAYIDFGGESVLELINKYDNLLVIQTFSKSRALAGMRLGFAAGDKNLIEGLKKVKFSFNSYTINRLSIKAGTAAVKDSDYFYKTVDKLIETREKTKKLLKDYDFYVPDSKTNFLFVSHKKISGEELYLKLREEGILVRYFKKPGIDNFIRVTVGSEKEMEIFSEKIKKILK